MTKKKKHPSKFAEIVPLFGRDEMNLIEFPFGPITPQSGNTFEVEHTVFDRKLKREVNRNLLITGSDAFGLPRPIDDQVLMGMKALTHEAGFKSKKVEFSRYQLCKTLGWPTDGRTYKRLEESLDRIAGTTLKFKDSWWDHGEAVWKSKTFHLIEEVELWSRDSIERARLENGRSAGTLSSFIWSDAIWKSFADGYMKKVDMTMWRKISSKRRKEVALRLYRILDKRFYRKAYVRFDLRKLCLGTLGVSRGYAPSQMVRVVSGAAEWLIECGFLREFRIQNGRSGGPEATFIKVHGRGQTAQRQRCSSRPESPTAAIKYYESLSREKQERLLRAALQHCKTHKPKAFDGYQRNEHQAGATFESYRELVIRTFLASRSEQHATAA